MKKLLTLILILSAIISLSACTTRQQNRANQQDDYTIDKSDFVDGQNLIQNIETQKLDQNEIDGLILMREEEKLARDVYTILGKKWNMNIFYNIADSEQTHTNSVKTLLDRYDIEDPVTDETIGFFQSQELKDLYNSLTAKGSTSLLDALVVGATIEDLDIKDLNELTAETDNEDIVIVYNNLNKGSRNHLRAFIRQIEKNGGAYKPQYISQSEFDEIIRSEQEKGAVR